MFESGATLSKTTLTAPGKHLTVDYGMRFVWIPPQYDVRNQIALFDPSTYVKSAGIQIDTNGNPISGSGNALEGMEFASNGTLPRGGWDGRGVMPEPRIGVARDPIGDHKGVLRGGFGMSHDREQGNLAFNPAFTTRSWQPPLPSPPAPI
jgi:hypothetical protein